MPRVRPSVPRSAAFLLAAAAVLVPSAACRAVREPALESRQVPEYAIEDFMGTTAYGGASFSADGKSILVSSDQTGIFNAVSIPVDGSAPTPLTHSTTDSIQVQSYFPGDERFLYQSDQGGNELDHLYVRERDGTAVDLTPGDKLKAAFAGWARDEKSFFVTTNERDPRYFDLYEYAVDGYARTLLYKNEAGFQPGPVSPDRRYVAVSEVHTETDQDIHLIDRKTGQSRVVTAHKEEMFNQPVTFSLDGKWLYYLSDEASDFRYLVRMDLASGKREVVEKPDWDIEDAGFSRLGKWLWIAINVDARTELRLYEAAGMKPVRLPTLPEAAITSVRFSPDETQAAFYVNGSRQPSDLYVLDLGSGRARPLTRSLNAKINADDLVTGEPVRFPSFDNVQVPGILYKPHRAAAGAPVPALVWVHGGPGGQSRRTYSGLLQYLVNHGYAVFAINNRGSSGYGKTFYKLDDRHHGDTDLGDCVHSKKMLAATGYVDSNRIGIIGGSYGGYMVLAALAFRPQEFAVGVDIFGVANWLRTLQSIPPYWESFRKALYQEIGDPTVDEAYLRKISPLFHAANIRKPLLVLQGANDPRVLKVESDEVVEAVKANGVPVEYVVFDDEGHGFRKKENQNRGYSAILTFLDQRLKATNPPPEPPAIGGGAATAPDHAAPAAPEPAAAGTGTSN
jgi:dipeptidyl aminopeptidase/acylaminoacyl peptidase